jgi:hypothetical protein
MFSELGLWVLFSLNYVFGPYLLRIPFWPYLLRISFGPYLLRIPFGPYLLRIRPLDLIFFELGLWALPSLNMAMHLATLIIKPNLQPLNYNIGVGGLMKVCKKILVYGDSEGTAI